MVRIDKEDMNRLNVNPGDLVLLYGKEESIGIVWAEEAFNLFLKSFDIPINVNPRFERFIKKKAN